jgi:hypothetical protein
MNVCFYSANTTESKNNDNNKKDTALPVPSSTSKEKSWYTRKSVVHTGLGQDKK